MLPNKSIRITRTARLPDPVRINRYAKAPELGPRMLFFSGGSALNKASRILKNYTHNSVHMVTPFDSGGSSAKLRKAFAMPSIGDLRSRLMALADENITGQPEVYKLFNYRFPAQGEPDRLLAQLDAMEDQAAKERNRAKSRVRAKVEHIFAIIKRTFGYTKVRYRGLNKNAHALFVLCALTNLYLARRRLRTVT